MKRTICRVLRVFGVDALFRYFFRRRVLVLMYHGVLSDHDASGDGDWLQVRASEFEAQMRYLARHYEVSGFAHAMSGKRSSRPLAIITFDDGYANNCSIALPILRKLGLPATIFVATGFVDTPRQFWWDRLRMGRAGGKALSKEEEDRLKSQHPYSIDAAVDAILDSDEGSQVALSVESYRALNRREIDELLESGLVELGSHTHQHEILLHLSDDEIRSTLQLSSASLSQWGAAGRWFAAPNGDFRREHLRLVQEAGYEICVGTRPTGLWKVPCDRFSIPRIGIGRGMTMDEFALAASGAIAWGKSLRWRSGAREPMSVPNPSRMSGFIDPPVFRLQSDFTVSVTELLAGALSPEHEAAWVGTLEVPALGELKQQILASERQAWMLEFRQHGRLVTVFPVFIEIRKVRGITLRTLSLAGYDFYDYLPLSQAGVPDVIWQSGVRRVCAHFHADAAYLNHLVNAPAGCLARFSQSFSNICFDQGVGGGWQTLLRIESVKRVVNKAKRLYRYRVETYEGLPPPSLFAVIAGLHVERWRYDGVASPFARTARRNEYAASESRALCTVIFDADTVVAANLGLVFGRRLLFQTPIVNIEYLPASPLKLLLHETIAECARRNFEVFDLGLGDEAYKNRFCNVKRPMWNLFLPRTMRAYLAFSLLNWQAAPGLKRLVSAWRLRLARRFAHHPLILARAAQLEMPDPIPPTASFVWKKVENFSDFVRFCREVELFPVRCDHDRFKAGAHCLFAIDGGRAIGKYWVRSGTQWSDPSCLFVLNVQLDKVWVFGSQSLNGSDVAALFPRLESFFGSADLRIVLEAANCHEILAATHAGFVIATDVTIQAVKPPTNVELN